LVETEHKAVSSQPAVLMQLYCTINAHQCVYYNCCGELWPHSSLLLSVVVW